MFWSLGEFRKTNAPIKPIANAIRQAANQDRARAVLNSAASVFTAILHRAQSSNANARNSQDSRMFTRSGEIGRTAFQRSMTGKIWRTYGMRLNGQNRSMGANQKNMSSNACVAIPRES